MALNLPVFYKRTASAAVFAAVMMTGLLWNTWSFLGLMLLINALCLRDFFKLMKKIVPDAYWPEWLPGATQVLSILLLVIIADNLPEISLIRLAPLLALAPAVGILVIVLSKQQPIAALSQSLLGICYITVPMLFLLEMRGHNQYLPIALILMIWANDTMAYLVGSFFGKTPFSPISPKKTWEGTAGGALLTLVAAGLYGYYSHYFRVVDWVSLALIATVFGTLGDLLESKLKRLADVKDSGTMMPGHGGALDRFDSLLVAAPFAAVYVILFMN